MANSSSSPSTTDELEAKCAAAVDAGILTDEDADIIRPWFQRVMNMSHGDDSTDSPRAMLNRERVLVITDVLDGRLPAEDGDRLLEFSKALDKHYPRPMYVDEDGKKSPMTAGTTDTYVSVLRRQPRKDGLSLTDLDPVLFNDFMAMLDTGDHPESPEGGYSRNTVTQIQDAAKAFYTYFDDLGVARGEIDRFQSERNVRHDADDMFDEEDVEALRRAVSARPFGTRDRALLEMMIWTGQRIRALQTLKVGDVDASPTKNGGGVFYLNDDHEGLKHADERGRERRLFGARDYVRRWLEAHPQDPEENPDAWLWVGDPNHHKTDLSKPLTMNTMRRNLKVAAKNAGVNKPVNPHNFRHYWVTTMKKEYDMNDDTVKMLMGHSAQSNVMKTTYQHVTNDDYLAKAEEDLGYREEKKDRPLTPANCPVCGENLKSHWTECPACNEEFRPGVDEATEQTKGAALDSAFEAEDAEKQEAIRMFLEFMEKSPETAAEVLEEAFLGS